MATIVGTGHVSVEITFTVSEDEARALDALAGYGDDAFIEAFYSLLGEHYMKPHERGLRTFLKSIRQQLGVPLAAAKAARQHFRNYGGGEVT